MNPIMRVMAGLTRTGRQQADAFDELLARLAAPLPKPPVVAPARVLYELDVAPALQARPAALMLPAGAVSAVSSTPGVAVYPGSRADAVVWFPDPGPAPDRIVVGSGRGDR